jgi:hypothetical protein
VGLYSERRESAVSNWFHQVAGSAFLFGFRSRKVPSGRWQEAVRDRCGLDLQRGRAHWCDEFVGDYRFVELVDFTSGRSDTEQWLAPHPCPPLGSLHGLLSIRWRSSLPVKKRVEVAERVCFELCGPVINTETGEVFDPVQMKSFHLENLTSKWGFSDGDVFFDDAEYRVYVHRVLGGIARRSGVDVSDVATSHNPFRTFDANDARRTRGASKTVELWCFDRLRFRESELEPFFATNETTSDARNE